MSQPDPVSAQRPSRRPDPARLGGNGRLASYLTAGVTGATMATAHSEAAVVAINLGPTGLNLLGQNGGVSDGSYRSISNWLGANTGTLEVFNDAGDGDWGIAGLGGLQFAIGTGGYASPRRFVAGQPIYRTGTTFTSANADSLFGYDGYYYSSNFSASPKSFMGFRFYTPSHSGPPLDSGWNYGYLEVTWSQGSTTFQILSGAYESQQGVAILAGATPVPAPSALALLALGGGAFRRARARAA